MSGRQWDNRARNDTAARPRRAAVLNGLYQSTTSAPVPERFDAAAPSTPLQILGRVQADPKDPRPQVVDLGQSVLGAPAAQERFLGDVLSVLLVSEHEPECAGQFVAHVRKRAQQEFARRLVR